MAGIISRFFYVLVQSWPPVVSKHNRFNNYILNDNYYYWILHGLWTNRTENDGKFISYIKLDSEKVVCTAPDYQKPTSKALMNSLEVLAPSLVQDKAHSEEPERMYNKHGKCAVHFGQQENFPKPILTSNEYLNRAVHLAVQYNMGKFVRKFFLGERYTIGAIAFEIEKQIYKQIGPEYVQGACDSVYYPYITTLWDENEQHYLNEVHLFFNTNFQLIKSQRSQENSSKEAIYLKWPTNDTNLLNANIPKIDLDDSNSNVES